LGHRKNTEQLVQCLERSSIGGKILHEVFLNTTDGHGYINSTVDADQKEEHNYKHKHYYIIKSEGPDSKIPCGSTVRRSNSLPILLLF